MVRIQNEVKDQTLWLELGFHTGSYRLRLGMGGKSLNILNLLSFPSHVQPQSHSFQRILNHG